MNSSRLRDIPDPNPNEETTPLKLPGFGLAVNKMPIRDKFAGAKPGYPSAKKIFCFPNAMTSWCASNTTIRERTILAIINELSDKSEWERKVNDEAIVARWKTEALKREGVDCSEDIFDYVRAFFYLPTLTHFHNFIKCILELRAKAPRFLQTGRIAILDSEAAIVKSDIAIPESLTEDLKAAVSSLEDVPERDKDWHPGSNGKVLDLVHPSLYPLMYGRSRVFPFESRMALTPTECLQRHGEGVVIPKPSQNETSIQIPGGKGNRLPNGISRFDSRWQPDDSNLPVLGYWSDSYQWLPSKVAFRGDDEVEISSYVNNLHPRHTALYSVLEKIIARTIPLWDDCLSYFGFKEPQGRVPVLEIEWEYPEEEEDVEGDDGDDEDDSESSEASEENDSDESQSRARRILVQPSPINIERVPFRKHPAVLTHVNLRQDWKAEGLQIIVKLANIELRPEEGKTSHEGGTWHIEGQLNEHICASAIYYYDQSNITESRLAFRQLTKGYELEDIEYPQDDYEGIETLFGVKQQGPALQILGSVVTKEGRLVAFPNVLQHRVEPFGLVDAEKPGYRKILALFLVDPYIRTLSTANVPPQQKVWWADLVYKNESTRLSKLPVEVFDRVVEMTEDWPISLEEAKKVREELMAQRRHFVGKVNGDFEQQAFSFCEH
ncbi:hypothetical protein AAF712_008630 [Marasmius tenuissimus]|uniref:Uncharacterized protein n=1 Tax=Marasmius tenuissimus TaxID=585030 RepID=A0ABR2ZSB5_9AGAR